MKKIPTKTSQVLTPFQYKILKDFFKEVVSKEFFLTGGTALAGFYLFHRKSVDLDLFSYQPLDHLLLEQTVKNIANQNGGDQRTINTFKGTFHSFVISTPSDSVKLDFVSDVPVRFGTKESFEDIKVDSLENIAVNKITAIFGRTDQKDFVDLYFLLKSNKFNLEDLIKKAKKKDLGLTEFYLAGALGNIQKSSIMPKMLIPLSHEKLEKYMLELSNQLFLKIKPEK